MNENGLHTFAGVLDALTFIQSRQPTGYLEMTASATPVSLIFAGGALAGFGADTLRQRFLPFLGQQGMDSTALFGAEPDPAALVAMVAIHPLVIDFVEGILAEGLAGGTGITATFRAAPIDPSLDAASIVRVDRLILNICTTRLTPAVIESLLPDRHRPLTLVADALPRTRELELTPQQGFVLTRIQPGMTLGDLLLGSGLPEEEVLRALLVFRFYGLLQPDTPAPAPAAAASPPASAGSRPAPAGPPSPAAPATRRRTARPVAAPEPSAEDDTLNDSLREEIDDLAIIADKGTLYEILELTPYDDTDSIKKSFLDMTRRFHPDKYQRFGDPDILKKIDTIYARIAEAYETLKDPANRGAYDQREGIRPQEAPADSPSTASKTTRKNEPARQAYEDREHRAKQHYLHGRDAFRVKKFHDATEHFREAVRLMPEVPEYLYMLAKVLSLNPQRYKEAEERLLQAVEKAPHRVELIVELGHFYERVNLPLRARRYFEKALQMDPDNEEAMRGLGIRKKQKHSLKDLFKKDLKDLFKSDKDE